jgi:ubiquitin-activating enzyme E1
MTEPNSEIDYNLYSRQIGAFGVEAMAKLVQMRVLLLGLSGIGLETAKNLILAGPKSLTIFDPKAVQANDLEFNYYLNQEAIASGLSRAKSTIPKLAELNQHVIVSEGEFASIEDMLIDKAFNDYNVVVVADWYPINSVQLLNKKCHEANKGFVLALTAGLTGTVFVDFGPSHKIFDKNGEESATGLIMHINSDGLVVTQEDKRHGLEEGDMVKLTELVGMEELNGKLFKVLKTPTPYSFVIGDLKQTTQSAYIRNGMFEQVKEVVSVAFKPLEESLKELDGEFIDCDPDYENLERIPFLKYLVHHFWKIVSENGFPDLLDTEKLHGFKFFLKTNLKRANKLDWTKHLEDELCEFFFLLASGSYSPVFSFFGGIAAQEVVKFTGKFTPINQWFIHEFYSNIFRDYSVAKLMAHSPKLKETKDSRYLSHIALMGRDTHDELRNAKVFLVGAGALGCEFLKLFAMSGICCGTGKVSVTDDDTIEVSNLNRQFLFRSKHVGKSKSHTAAEAVIQMNADIKIEALKSRVSDETSVVFTDTFWDEQTIIVNAVDNVKARQYIDHKAVLHVKPLFESGTLGTKCNSQLIIPNVTECYNDSQDPEEKGVPMCTLRNFPYAIEHTIEWARSKFFDLFVEPSKFLKNFAEDPKKASEDFKKNLKNNVTMIRDLVAGLTLFLPLLENPDEESFIRFALHFFKSTFDQHVKELLRLFPPDYKNEFGELFWVSPKRPPVPIPFAIDNNDHVAFIASIVNILSQIIIPGIAPIDHDASRIKTTIATKKLEDTKESGGEVSEKIVDKNGDLVEEHNPEENEEDTILELISKFEKLIQSHPGLSVKEIEFEKDHDENGHIDFISYAANFRATNYQIKNAPRHRIKIIAGRIIPAIATTTAMVVGAVGIEIYKYFMDTPPSAMRNFFSNLSLPIFLFSEPNPPVVRRDADFDPIVMGPVVAIPTGWHTWSRFVIDGPLTLNQIMEKIKSIYGFTINSVAIENKMVWTSYSSKFDSRKEMLMEQILQELCVPVFPGKRYQVISLSGELEDQRDVLCPSLKYVLDSQPKNPSPE